MYKSGVAKNLSSNPSDALSCYLKWQPIYKFIPLLFEGRAALQKVITSFNSVITSFNNIQRYFKQAVRCMCGHSNRLQSSQYKAATSTPRSAARQPTTAVWACPRCKQSHVIGARFRQQQWNNDPLIQVCEERRCTMCIRQSTSLSIRTEHVKIALKKCF